MKFIIGMKDIQNKRCQSIKGMAKVVVILIDKELDDEEV